MSAPLTPARRSELRAEAHKLKPVVLIGDKGLTDEVVAEIDRSLTAHELIKVRAATDEREARAAWMEAICERLGAHPVQSIGKILVLYRENPEKRLDSRRRGNDGTSAKAPDSRRRGNDGTSAKAPDSRRRGSDGTSAKAPDSRRRRELAAPREGRGKPLVRKPLAKEAPRTGRKRPWMKAPEEPDAATGSGRRRSRTPSPRPESGPRRRRPRTSR